MTATRVRATVAALSALLALGCAALAVGHAGVDVPLNVLRNTEKMQLKVRSGDRAGFQRKGTLQ